MTRHLILVASYTNSVVSLEFDTDKPAQLPVLSAVEVGHHPSWLTSHPDDLTLVTTGLEQADGRIVTLKYDLSSGSGKVLSEVTSGGRDPCTLLVDTKAGEVLIGNYSSGSVYVAPISTDAPYVSPKGYRVTFEGTGPNQARQEASHPHQVIFHPEYPELFVPDLGADVVRRLKKDPTTGRWTPAGHIGFELGGGPRHVAFYNGDLFTLLELSSKVVRHKLPPLPHPPKFIASTTTMSNPPPSPNDMLAAEIHIPSPNSSFPVAYLYLSNRNDPSPEGDIISIYAIENPDQPLRLITEVRTGLNHVRGMEFFGEDNRYLIAGGGRGGGAKVFERIDGGKDLRVVAENTSLEAPTGFLVLDA
ncbi:putative isomerase YbhE [Coprinopsis marcescibilis]|uniref:Putative isomerase YbhE n=1 Tax=Coprinopsis marcescibilis TaxID=230819 RepID=A0A5C3L028_COPMA|nr:putative isomerase YbhE [Coprinopsis marcescibilis]